MGSIASELIEREEMRFIVLAGLLVFLLLPVSGCTADTLNAENSPALNTGDSTGQNTVNSPDTVENAQGFTLSDADYNALKKSMNMPAQSMTDVVESEGYTIDLSGKNQGYVTVSSENIPANKIKVQISKDDEKYNYDYTGQDPFTTYPLQLGNGVYKITVYENIDNDQYAQVMGTETDVQLENEFAPYLLPSQIVKYTPESNAVYESLMLTGAAQNDLERVADVYGYIVDNIAYDQQKADSVQTGYLPDVDETLSSKKGICYDYSALLACMLRAKNIPTRLVMGYVSGVDVYHAWNEVYITDVGWVRTAIYFDGTNWQTADSTFGAANAQAAGKDAEYTRVKWY